MCWSRPLGLFKNTDRPQQSNIPQRDLFVTMNHIEGHQASTSHFQEEILEISYPSAAWVSIFQQHFSILGLIRQFKPRVVCTYQAISLLSSRMFFIFILTSIVRNKKNLSRVHDFNLLSRKYMKNLYLWIIFIYLKLSTEI